MTVIVETSSSKLFEYYLMLKELDKHYGELERLENKYKNKLKKKRYNNAFEQKEKILDTLTSQTSTSYTFRECENS